MSIEQADDLDYYERGETTYFALQSDPRFGYCLFVPPEFRFANAANFELIVVVHGSARTPHTYRALFRPFAEVQRCIVLAPMFPSRVFVAGEEANYKFMRCGELRFDQLLLDMIGEVQERYRVRADRVLMHGFSGGGHFAHRFFYLHPERLMGVSIGAPGMVTLLDDQQDWHCGTRDFTQQFGQSLDLQAMRQVPVQMVIGSEDTDTWEITIESGDKLWMAGVNDAGRTRIDRLTALQRSFREAGIDSRFDVVPKVAHRGFELLEPVRDFFLSALDAHRSRSRRSIAS